MGVGGQPRRNCFTPGKDPVPLVLEAGWASEPVWTGVENLAPTGIQSPDRPARSELLYRLSNPGSLYIHTHTQSVVNVYQTCIVLLQWYICRWTGWVL
jgi:hypothetical protein